MPWSTLTANDVEQELNPTERDVIDAAQGRSLLDGIVVRVVAMIRGAILAGGTPVESDDTKIPDSLFPDAIDICRWRYLIALPKASLVQTEERKEQFNTARERLDRLAEGKLKVEAPATAGSAAAVRGGLEQVGDSDNDVTRSTLDGL